MATSVSLGFPLWADGETFNAQLGRQAQIGGTFSNDGTTAAIQVHTGVIAGTGTMVVSASSGMNITVAAGFAVVANSSSSLQGAYVVPNMTRQTLTVATADATNPRIDLVVVRVHDNGDSTTYAAVELVTGVAAPSPAAPATPANSLVLAQVRVNAGTASIAQTNITDTRLYTAAAGGIVPWPKAAQATGGTPGLMGYDIATNRFFHNDGTGKDDQPHILPWNPMQVSQTTDINLGHSSAATTVHSLNFTADGHTDVKITFSFGGAYMNVQPTGGANFWVWVQFFLDSNRVFSYNTPMQNMIGQSYATGGGTATVYSGAGGLFGTPSAGTHTFKIVATEYGQGAGTDNVFLNGPMSMRVEPVIL